jgi:hypothetical protein
MLISAGAKIDLARQLDPPAAAARGLGQAMGGSGGWREDGAAGSERQR